MGDAQKCGQANCDEEATERFIWPGSGWSVACASCALRAVHVAGAMGFPLTVEPLPEHAPDPLARKQPEPMGFICLSEFDDDGTEKR